jgi:hypothetical protein
VDKNTGFTQDGCGDEFETSDLDFCFADRVPDGSDYPSLNAGDEQIYARGDLPNETKDCGVVRVKETGYYAVYDSELSESCEDQVDETGYLTIQNSCNGDGWAVQRNVGERYLVSDADNQGSGCTDDNQCDVGYVCREGNAHGNCCVPDTPVYMGTYLLVAGEENVICINHWCPEWEEAFADGDDLGFISHPGDAEASCSSPDSIHFKIAATALVCKQEGFLQACAGGCSDAGCDPHPCFEKKCDAFCEMNADGKAVCVDDNPCSGKACENGCVFGLCLQDSNARGPDEDGDGFSAVADCDDDNPDVNPGVKEVKSNGVDDDCDGFIDEGAPSGSSDAGAGDAGSTDGGAGAGSDVDAGTGPGNGSGADGGVSENSGCGCQMVPVNSTALLALPALLGLSAARRVRRRRRLVK